MDLIGLFEGMSGDGMTLRAPRSTASREVQVLLEHYFDRL